MTGSERAGVVFERVTKRYGEQVAVDELSLHAPEGAITVFVGPSGCGKTTSLRMINRMVEPTSGRLTVGGQDVTAIDEAELRRGIGYVIQHGGLFPHQSVERNVMTVPLLLGWDKRKARDRARELLDLVGLPGDFHNRYPSQLSGGQQQRVGVARALAADPPVLLMDEPFSAVDPVVRDQLQDELLALQARLRKTIVFVTHDIDEAIKLGDQVAVLRTGGHLAQVADPATLLANPADDFVASFVGRDRGYRSLGFVDTGARLRVRDEPVATLGAPLPTADDVQAAEHWMLVVDEDRHPQGWVRVPEAEARLGSRASTTDHGAAAGPSAGRSQAVITRDDLALGGTLARRTGSLRALLDAALSSPSRRGVVVDEDGRLLGTVTVSDAVAAIEAQRPAAELP